MSCLFDGECITIRQKTTQTVSSTKTNITCWGVYFTKQHSEAFKCRLYASAETDCLLDLTSLHSANSARGTNKCHNCLSASFTAFQCCLHYQHKSMNTLELEGWGLDKEAFFLSIFLHASNKVSFILVSYYHIQYLTRFYWLTPAMGFEPLKAELLKVGLSLGCFCTGPPECLNSRMWRDAVLPDICPLLIIFTWGHDVENFVCFVIALYFQSQWIN